MARNGSGTYSLPAGNPVVTGTTISSTDFNNTMTDIATALSGSVSADGQTPWSGNQNANGNRLTAIAAAAALTDAANANDVQTGKLTYLVSVAGTNTITATLANLAAYTAGETFRFIAAGKNTGATTLNVNSLGAKAITKFGTTALASGDILSGSTVTVCYDGTQFQLMGVATQGSGALGWYQLPNGVIKQFGSATGSASFDSSLVFPIAFPNAAVTFVAVPFSGGTSIPSLVSVGSITLASVGFGTWVANTGARFAGFFTWEATGY